jgi:hypothetical protein
MLDPRRCTVRCLSHIIHLAVIAFLVEIGVVKKGAVKEDELPDLSSLTEEDAEAITGDSDEGEKDDVELLVEEVDEFDTKSVVGKVRVCQRFLSSFNFSSCHRIIRSGRLLA